MAREGISGVVLGWREAEPGVVHGEADLVGSLCEQLGVVLHHALEASRCLELSTISVGVLGVNELRDHTT